MAIYPTSYQVSCDHCNKHLLDEQGKVVVLDDWQDLDKVSTYKGWEPAYSHDAVYSAITCPECLASRVEEIM